MACFKLLFSLLDGTVSTFSCFFGTFLYYQYFWQKGKKINYGTRTITANQMKLFGRSYSRSLFVFRFLIKEVSLRLSLPVQLFCPLG